MEDNILYHYTSLEVLKCIFENYSTDNPYLTFWATNCAYMNDPKEISECIEIIEIAISGISCPILKERASFIFSQGNIKEAMLIMSTVAKSELGIPYALSLSRNKDNINMWRMYGNGGKGIALGFDINKLKNTDFELYDCLYNDKDSNDIVNEIRECIELLFVKMGKTPIDISQKDYEFIILLKVFSKIASQIKNNVYRYEKETRLITQCASPKFRVYENILIPYTIINIPIESLHSVILGPDCDIRNINSLRVFFLAKGLSDLASNIIESQVPYRN